MVVVPCRGVLVVREDGSCVCSEPGCRRTEGLLAVVSHRVFRPWGWVPRDERRGRDTPVLDARRPLPSLALPVRPRADIRPPVPARSRRVAPPKRYARCARSWAPVTAMPAERGRAAGQRHGRAACRGPERVEPPATDLPGTREPVVGLEPTT